MKNLVFTILILTVVGACGASIFDYFTTIYNQAREHVVDLADDGYAFASSLKATKLIDEINLIIAKLKQNGTIDAKLAEVVTNAN